VADQRVVDVGPNVPTVQSEQSVAVAEDHTVGASLLAIASGQSTWMLKLMPSSPAG
jgi:hypothetical protein